MNRANAKELKRILESPDVRASLQSFLGRQNATSRRTLKPMKQERLARGRLAREDRNAETARIRAECMKRAAGYCECGCGVPFIEGDLLQKPEMDEWLNGNGRRVQLRSVKTCWMLIAAHHLLRQRYIPDVATWSRDFAAHCKRHGYKFIPHIEHAAVQRHKNPQTGGPR